MYKLSVHSVKPGMVLYDDVYNDNRDFRSLIRSASSKEERQDLSNLRAVKMLMNGFNSDLDVAFKNLNLV